MAARDGSFLYWRDGLPFAGTSPSDIASYVFWRDGIPLVGPIAGWTGNAAGTSTALAASTTIKLSPGLSAGVAACLAVGVTIIAAVGAAAGVGTPTAEGFAGSNYQTGAGASAGVGTATGVGLSIGIANGVGSSSGTAAAAAVGVPVRPTTGSAAGTSTASGAGVASGLQTGVGLAAGTSTAFSGIPLRIYFPSAGTPPLSGLSFDVGWTDHVGAGRALGQLIRSATPSALLPVASLSTSPEFHAVKQYQIPHLLPQTYASLIKGQFRGRFLDADARGSIAISLRIVSADGLTLRGTLLSPIASSSLTTPPVFPAGLTNRHLQTTFGITSIALTPVTSLVDDILVIEIGIRTEDLSSGSRSEIEVRSDAAFDLPEDDTTEGGGFNPWIEFFSGPLFATVTSGAGTAAGHGTGAGVGVGTTAAAGSSHGIGVAEGAGPGLAPGVGSVAGSSTANAGGLGFNVPALGAGSAAGTSTASAVRGPVSRGAASAAGTATVAGIGTASPPRFLAPNIDDDGWGGTLIFAWTQVSGPDVATILNPSDSATDVNFPTTGGVYIFQLTVSRTDDALVSSALMRVIVIGAAVDPTIPVYGTPLVSTPAGYVLLSNQEAARNLLGFTPNGTYSDGITFPNPGWVGYTGTAYIEAGQWPAPGGTTVYFASPEVQARLAGLLLTTPGPVTVTANGNPLAVRIMSTNISSSTGQAASCTFSMVAVPGSPLPLIATGNDVILDRNGIRLFGGICLSLGIDYEDGVPIYHPALTGYRWHLGRARITKTYTNVPLDVIARELISRAPGGIEWAGQSGLPPVTVAFTDVSIEEAFNQLTKLHQGLRYSVDYFKRLHFAVVETGGDPEILTPAHRTMRGLSLTRSISGTVNRVRVYYTVPGSGGGQNSQGGVVGWRGYAPDPLAPGENFDGDHDTKVPFGAEIIRVGSLDGYGTGYSTDSQTGKRTVVGGGIVNIDGHRVSYSGTFEDWIAPVSGYVQFGDATAKAINDSSGQLVPGGYTYGLSILTNEGETRITSSGYSATVVEHGAPIYGMTATEQTIWDPTLQVPIFNDFGAIIGYRTGGYTQQSTNVQGPLLGYEPGTNAVELWILNILASEDRRRRMTGIGIYRLSNEPLRPGDGGQGSGGVNREAGNWILVGTVGPRGGQFIDKVAKENLAPTLGPVIQSTADVLGYFLGGCIWTGAPGDAGDASAPATYVDINDVQAQAEMAALLGDGSDGVIEAPSIQGGNISYSDARAVGEAYLTQQAQPTTSVTVTVKDYLAEAGKILDMHMPAPLGDEHLRIQQAGTTGFELGVQHEQTVTAATIITTLDDLLRAVTKTQ